MRKATERGSGVPKLPEDQGVNQGRGEGEMDEQVKRIKSLQVPPQGSSCQRLGGGDIHFPLLLGGKQGVPGLGGRVGGGRDAGGSAHLKFWAQAASRR